MTLTHPRWHRSKLYAPCLTEKLKESEIHLRIDHLYLDPAPEKAATGIWEKADSWQLWCLALSEITGNIPKGFPRGALIHEVRLPGVSSANNLWLQRNFSPWSSLSPTWFFPLIHPSPSPCCTSASAIITQSGTNHVPGRWFPTPQHTIPSHEHVFWMRWGQCQKQETSQPRS